MAPSFPVERASRPFPIAFTFLPSNTRILPVFLHTPTAHRFAVTPAATLRVNPDVDPHTHRYTTTGMRANKFGEDFTSAHAIFERFKNDSRVRLTGLHVHIGSLVYEPASYVEALERVLTLEQAPVVIGLKARPDGTQNQPLR